MTLAGDCQWHIVRVLFLSCVEILFRVWGIRIAGKNCLVTQCNSTLAETRVYVLFRTGRREHFRSHLQLLYLSQKRVLTHTHATLSTRITHSRKSIQIHVLPITGCHVSHSAQIKAITWGHQKLRRDASGEHQKNAAQVDSKLSFCTWRGAHTSDGVCKHQLQRTRENGRGISGGVGYRAPVTLLLHLRLPCQR